MVHCILRKRQTNFPRIVISWTLLPLLSTCSVIFLYRWVISRMYVIGWECWFYPREWYTTKTHFGSSSSAVKHPSEKYQYSGALDSTQSWYPWKPHNFKKRPDARTIRFQGLLYIFFWVDLIEWMMISAHDVRTYFFKRCHGRQTFGKLPFVDNGEVAGHIPAEECLLKVSRYNLWPCDVESQILIITFFNDKAFHIINTYLWVLRLMSYLWALRNILTKSIVM